MCAAAPEGYGLELSGDEPLYVLDEDAASLPAEESDGLLDEDTDPEGGDAFDPDEDDDAVDDTQQWSAPREWAPYCADTIAMREQSANRRTAWAPSGSAPAAVAGRWTVISGA